MMVAVEKLITDNIDIWSSAVKAKVAAGRGTSKKLDLYGIKKLRTLILELAVSGKLLPQDPNDEPVSALLKVMAKDEARLVKEGKIKKQKILPVISDDEKTIDYPANWETVRLGYIGYWAIGNGFPINEQGIENEAILFSKVSDMNLLGNEKYIVSTINYVSQKTAALLKLNIHEMGTVIFPKIGGAIATNKRRILVKPTAIDNNCLGITPFSGISSDYLFLYLTSIDLSKYQAGTSVPALSQGTLELITLGLPPLAEQNRIVAKVDELMALCDQLEQQTEASISAHQILVQTLLETLTNTSEHEGFNQAWARIAEHFDTLFTTEWSIDQLKQTILQLAVMGKLVPQNPNDEPASVLLEKITAEKERLVKEKEIKKQKELPEIIDDEKPFVLPAGWGWSKCQDICYKITDGEHATPKRTESGHYLLSARNVTNEGIIVNDVDFVPTSEFERIRKRCDPNIGDVLISCSGSVGRVALVDKDDAYSMVRSAAMIRPDSNHLVIEYIALLLRSPYLQLQIKKRSKQSAQANLFLGAISNLVFIIPPKLEQHRIVDKVDELMTICDTLKTRINTEQITQLHLADALAEQVLN